MPLKVGNSFFMAGTGGINNPGGGHLMVCIAVVPPNGDAVVIPIVSQHAFSDESCLIKVGDHPFISRDSCAAYDHGRVLSQSAVEGEIKSGRIRMQSQVNTDLLVRLQIGFVTSDETEPRLFNAGNGTALTAHLKHKGHL